MKQHRKNLFPSKNAFTLAEVLITLGIIGVVAALTIPTLMTNIRASKFRTQYKKSISVLNQSVRLFEEQHEYNFASLGSNCSPFSNTNSPDLPYRSVCTILENSLKIAEGYQNEVPNNLTEEYDTQVQMGSKIFYVLNDGTYLFIYEDQNYLCTASNVKSDSPEGIEECIMYVDVNGSAKPNKVVQCSSGSGNDCIVNKKDVTDIYPLLFYDATLEPYSDAAKAVFRDGK